MRRHNSYCAPDNSVKMTACLQPTIVTGLAHSCQQQISYAMTYSHMTGEISQDSMITPARIGCIWHGDNYVGGLLVKGIVKQLAFHMHMVSLPVELSGIIVAVHVLKPAHSTAPQSHMCASNAISLMSIAIAISAHFIKCKAICTLSLSATLNPLRCSQQASDSQPRHSCQAASANGVCRQPQVLPFHVSDSDQASAGKDRLVLRNI